MSLAHTLLRIDSSPRKETSVTRALNDTLIRALTKNTEFRVINRDLSDGIGFVSEKWVEGTFMPDDQRTDDHKAALTESDTLVAELQEADVIVIGAPIYNFGVPASLKAWIDLIARAGVTFKFTNGSSEGLLTGKKAYISFAYGGTTIGSKADFASAHLKHVLAFVGITEVTFISSEEDIVAIESSQSEAA